MPEARTFTIHKSKQSLVDRYLSARASLRRSLEETPHRMEFAGTVNGVECINDSRSEDLLSTRDSFKCIATPIVWIALAPAHERDYALLEQYFRHKVKAIVVTGVNADDLRLKLEPWVDQIVAARSLEDGLKLALRFANETDTVLYSPGCQQGDGHENYVQRGQAFKELVEKLAL